MKSYFGFTRQQRIGIVLLILLICLLQAGIFYFKSVPGKKLEFSSEQLVLLEQIDSLKTLAKRERVHQIKPFNPNFITDYKGYILGLSPIEIDRLHAYREKGLWINSAKEFQKVSSISDSLLESISIYFKFPEWVNSSKKIKKTTDFQESKKLSFNEKMDLNSASEDDLMKIYGIGETYANRIIRYRQKHDGFLTNAELNLIYGLSEEVIERILDRFTVKNPRQIETYDLNEINQEELVQIPFIDYELAFQIIEERTLRDGFKSLDELTKVKDFPSDKFDIIKLYLFLL